MIQAIRGMRRSLIGLPIAVLAAAAAAETAPERIEVAGEMVDSWCYFSGVMGGYDAVVGSAHHTCALWCAKGGIPVGLLADDGTMYLVLRLEGADPLAEPETLLTVASDRLVADGLHYERDGVNYIVVEAVVENDGITNLNHEDFGPVPGFAIPEPAE